MSIRLYCATSTRYSYSIIHNSLILPLRVDASASELSVDSLTLQARHFPFRSADHTKSSQHLGTERVRLDSRQPHACTRHKPCSDHIRWPTSRIDSIVEAATQKKHKSVDDRVGVSLVPRPNFSSAPPRTPEK